VMQLRQPAAVDVRRVPSEVVKYYFLVVVLVPAQCCAHGVRAQVILMFPSVFFSYPSLYELPFATTQKSATNHIAPSQ
jgi:hypothetical protein